MFTLIMKFYFLTAVQISFKKIPSQCFNLAKASNSIMKISAFMLHCKRVQMFLNIRKYKRTGMYWCVKKLNPSNGCALQSGRRKDCARRSNRSEFSVFSFEPWVTLHIYRFP